MRLTTHRRRSAETEISLLSSELLAEVKVRRVYPCFAVGGIPSLRTNVYEGCPPPHIALRHYTDLESYWSIMRSTTVYPPNTLRSLQPWRLDFWEALIKGPARYL